MAGTNKTYVKAGVIAVGVIVALVLITSHPIISVLIGVVGVAYWAIDNGKTNL